MIRRGCVYFVLKFTMPSIRDSTERYHSKKSKKDYDKRGSDHYERKSNRRHRSRSYRASYERSRSRDRKKDRKGHKRHRDHSHREKKGTISPVDRSFFGEKNDTTIGSIIAESRVNALANSADSNNIENEGKKKRKSRWAESAEVGKTLPGVPTILPPNLTPLQEKAFLLQLQVEEISRKLRFSDWEIPEKIEDRSPSPEPIYNNLGIRMNTREVRVKKKLEDQRYTLIADLIKLNPDYKPPLDFRPNQQKYIDKVWIPQDSNPLVNFVGLIIGPRGNTLKQLEKETGAKIIIRGKGSMKEGKIGRPDGQPLPGADEPLHAYITAATAECLKKAMDLITQIIKEAIEVPEADNELRKNQLKQLALLNGTLRDPTASLMSIMTVKCSNCGSDAHKTWQCPEAPNITASIVCTLCGGGGHVAMDCKQLKIEGGLLGSTNQLDEEYMSLMAELGQNPVLNPAGAPKKLESITPLVKKVIETRPSIRPNPSYPMPNIGGPPLFPHQQQFPTYPTYGPIGMPPNPFMTPFPMPPFMRPPPGSESQDGVPHPPFGMPMPFMIGSTGQDNSNLPPWAIQDPPATKPATPPVDPVQPPPPPPSLSGFNIDPLPPPPPPQSLTSGEAQPQPPSLDLVD